MGFDTGHLSEWSAATQQNTVLSVLDWPADLLDLWKKHISREPSFVGMRPDAPILRAVDVPPRERTGFLFEETFLRPRLADALSFRLWSPDGRFVGTVSATVGGRSPFDDLAGGATNRAIAARFALTPRTVATYIERVLIKTGCPNRIAAAQLATRLRLTTG